MMGKPMNVLKLTDKNTGGLTCYGVASQGKWQYSQQAPV